MYPILPLPSLLGSLPLDEVYQGLGHGGLEGSLLGGSGTPEESGSQQPYAGLLAIRDQHCPPVPEADNSSEAKIDVEKVEKAPEWSEKLEIGDGPKKGEDKEGDYDLLEELKIVVVDNIEEENFVVLFNNSVMITE
ncbi:hypothetical protein B9Z55_003756 [Caenorhabditis nigoni]|uniref:Uncharacterized protein n=1 Tax=Caenorhabditis nigoni TaxID=1611254 RepID=A0A2G5VSI8_9PELO|nr:hypothetical protein B9Z55_003756 [Caenorhabditis nigoni]